jgi:hypothetical protein
MSAKPLTNCSARPTGRCAIPGRPHHGPLGLGQPTALEQDIPYPLSGTHTRTAAPWQEWVKAAFILIGGATGVLLLAVVGKYALNFPESHPFPIALGVVLGIFVGYPVGFFLFTFLMMFYMSVVVLSEKLGFVKYSDKVGWTLSVILWIFVVLEVGMPELNVRQTTNAVTWFVAFGFGPCPTPASPAREESAARLQGGI